MPSPGEGERGRTADGSAGGGGEVQRGGGDSDDAEYAGSRGAFIAEVSGPVRASSKFSGTAFALQAPPFR